MVRSRLVGSEGLRCVGLEVDVVAVGYMGMEARGVVDGA